MTLHHGWAAGWGGGGTGFSFQVYTATPLTRPTLCFLTVQTHDSVTETPDFVFTIDHNTPSPDLTQLEGIAVDGVIVMLYYFFLPQGDVYDYQVNLARSGKYTFGLVGVQATGAIPYSATNYEDCILQSATDFDTVPNILTFPGWTMMGTEPTGAATVNTSGGLGGYNMADGNLVGLLAIQDGSQFPDTAGDVLTPGFIGADGGAAAPAWAVRSYFNGDANSGSNPQVTWNHGFGGTPSSLGGIVWEVTEPSTPPPGTLEGGVGYAQRRLSAHALPYYLDKKLLR